MLLLEPRRPDAHLQPALGDMIHGDGLRGEDGRMAVGDPGDERAEADPLRGGRERRQKRPRLHAGSARISVERLEVIEDPRAVEAGVLREPDALEELRPGPLMLRDVESESHGYHLRTTPAGEWD